MAVVVLGASCRSAKKIQASPVTIIADTATKITEIVNVPIEDTAAIIKNNYQLIQQNKIDVTTFSAKIDVNYRDADGRKIDANVNLRMHKDSVIWVSLTGALGIEGARVYITVDSVKIINKQDKIYSAHSISYLQELTDLPLDLKSLQELLLGNPVFLDANIVSFTRASDHISLLSYGDFYTNLFTINEGTRQVVSSRLDDKEPNRNRNSLLSYDSYENKMGILFSTKRRIEVTDTKKLDIELEFKQYNFNETLSFPFNMPKNYKRN
jgi:hypothetical protein